MPPNYANQATRYVIPPIESGYDLSPSVGLFSVIMPLGTDKTNLVTNPSVELATTGYSVNIGGSIARDSTVQKFGVYSLKCIPSASSTDGWKYDTVSLVAGTQYVASMWFKGQANLKYRMDFVSTAPILLGSPTKFIATGFWQRVSVVYLETATTTRRVYVRKDNQTNVAPFWTDGLQVEADGLTTYLDGDMRGFVRNRADFYWTGVPHASTSVRIGQCRSGGKVVSLNDLGFRLLSIIGLGMGGIINQLTPLARGGAYYGGTVISDRQFTLVGQVDDSSGYLQLARKRQALIDLFKPDVVSPVQPVILRYTPTDDCGNQQGNEQEIVCVYQDGLAGRVDNLNAERLGLQFQLYLPFVTQEVGNVAATLAYSTDITDADYALRRVNGEWLSLGTGFNGAINVVKADTVRGRIYYGGNFTTANGNVHYYAAYWNIETGAFVTMGGTGPNALDAQVYDFAIAPDGQVWAVGAFTSAGGATAKGIALFDPVSGLWAAFTATTTLWVDMRAVTIISDGTVFVGGTFTDWGDPAGDYLIQYDPVSFGFVKTVAGLNAAVYSLSPMADGYRVLLGGSFTAPFTRIAIYNPESTAFETTYSTANAPVLTLALHPSWGVVAVGGSFTLPVPYLATIVPGLNLFLTMGVLDALVARAVYKPNGDLYIGGAFTMIDGLTSLARVAIRSNTIWVPIDVVFPGAPTVNGIDLHGDDIYLGYTTAGTAVVAGGTTTITNTGSAATGPRLTFTGPGRLVSVRNVTTDKNILFNLTLLDDETVILDLTNPSNITFVSSFRGNILSLVVAGSQLSQFQLAPGANRITVFIDGTVDAGTSVTIQYRLTSHSLDASIPGRLLP